MVRDSLLVVRAEAVEKLNEFVLPEHGLYGTDMSDLDFPGIYHHTV